MRLWRQLVTGSLGIQPGVVPHLDAGGVVADHAQHQIQQQSGCTHSQPHPSPVDAAHQHHHRAGAHDEDGAGEVGSMPTRAAKTISSTA